MKGTHWFIIGLLIAGAVIIMYKRGMIKAPITPGPMTPPPAQGE